MRDHLSSEVLLIPGAVVWSLLLAGCMAQQADLKQTERALQQRIKQQDEQFIQARARQSAELSELREKELPQLRGELDRAFHKAQELQEKQADLEQRSAVLRQQTIRLEELAKKLDAENATRYAQVRESLNAQDMKNKSDRDQLRVEVNNRLDEINRQMEQMRKDVIDAVQRTNAALVKNVDARLEEHRKAQIDNQRALSETQARTEQLSAKFVQFSQALTGFKESLTALSERLSQEEQLNKALAAKLEADAKASAAHINETTKGVTGHLNEVNKSLNAVAQKLAARLDEQVGEVNANVANLAQKLTVRSDEQINQVNANLTTLAQTVTARLEDQDRRLDILTKALEQVSQEVQNRGGGKNGQRPHAAGSGHQPSVVPSPSSSGQAHDGAARHQESATGSDQESPRTAHLTEPAGGHEQEELVSKPPATKQTERPDKVEYERLLAAFREGDLEGARKGFTAFLSRYPNSDLAPNARYWLGESHYGKKDYKQAIDAYDRVELDYPQSEKVPAAILKKGYAYLALKDKKRATSAFRQIVTLYPKSPEAEKAGDKLSQLKESR